MLVRLRDTLYNNHPQGCPEWPQGHPIKECSCSASSIARYQKRISGPLLDRIDIHVWITKSSQISGRWRPQRLCASECRHLERFKGTKLIYDTEMEPNEVREFCQTDVSGEKLLKAATQQLHLSVRAYHRVLKLTRTIAGLAGSEMIRANYVAEGSAL